jgi:hypothetical protein
MRKIQKLGKTSAESTLKILQHLYKMPIVGIADIIKWTNFTNPGGYKAIQRLVDMEILKPLNHGATNYGQKWVYDDYLKLFVED